jgi:hypothetical protein
MPRAAAYLAYKTRMDTAGAARRQPVLRDGYKRKGHGPWQSASSSSTKPAWVKPSGSNMPAFGSRGTSPYGSAHMDARETAYRAMVDRVSNAWKSHRRPARPSGEGGT